MKRDIYTYDDPVEFMSDRLKICFPPLTHREFSLKLGLKSPATLNHIFTGRRKITPDMTVAIGEALSLSATELRFFEVLVAYSRVKTTAERESIFADMQRMRSKSTAFQVGLKGHIYFSHWFYAPLIELLHFKECTLEDAGTLGRMLYPTISAQDARRAIEKLIELELVSVGEGGVLKRIPRAITAEGLPLSHLRNRNRELLEIAKAAQDDFSKEERNISSMTMAMSEHKFKRISMMIDRLRKDILNMEEDKGEMDRVVQVSFAAHPLTQLKEGMDDESV